MNPVQREEENYRYEKSKKQHYEDMVGLDRLSDHRPAYRYRHGRRSRSVGTRTFIFDNDFQRCGGTGNWRSFLVA